MDPLIAKEQKGQAAGDGKRSLDVRAPGAAGDVDDALNLVVRSLTGSNQAWMLHQGGFWCSAPAHRPPEQYRPSSNTTRYNGYVRHEDRVRLHGHPGIAVWFTGLSASGKSTIAHLLEKNLHEAGCSTYVLDGDNVRHGLCADLDFSPQDRRENIRRIGEMVKLFIDAGIIIITSFISPYREDREWVRSLLGQENYLEIYVHCPVIVCAQRDPKGLYARAMAGEIDGFTGVNAPYEEPAEPDLRVDSHEQTPEQSVERVMRLLAGHRLFNGRLAQKREMGALLC